MPWINLTALDAQVVESFRKLFLHQSAELQIVNLGHAQLAISVECQTTIIGASSNDTQILGTSLTYSKEIPIINLGDLSDDDGDQYLLQRQRMTDPTEVEVLVETNLNKTVALGVNKKLFFNAPRKVPLLRNVVKYEPGADYFQHMFIMQLQEQKEK